MMITPPQTDEYGEFYAGYVARMHAQDVLQVLETQLTNLDELLQGVAESQAEKRPTPQDWTLKEVIGHLIDAERVFSYRALRFSRRDETPLPSFDQEAFVANAHLNSRTLADLVEELRALRQANVRMFKSFTPEMLTVRGTASGNGVTVRALVYITAGHMAGHLEDIRTQYLTLA